MSAMATDIEYEPSTSTSVQWSQSCRQFQFQEIQLATDDFDKSRVIGRGGFGKVYRGTIYNGSAPVDAAIKRLDSGSHQGAPEFWAEVEMLSKLRHCHLVSLLGYCNHEKEMILVYEYMPNETLGDHLHKLGTPLSWLQRLNICMGAARGLDYLHTGTGTEFGVIHRDVKSSNVLLNESWAAKISDFGLSIIAPTNQTLTGVGTLVRGTFGYFDPEYYGTGRLTRKSDVYAFGVVLFEVLCRKRAVDTRLGEDQPNLARWAQESIKEGNLKHIIDYDIRGEISPNCLKEFVRVAERCLISNSKERPTMADVVVGLKYALTLQEKIDSWMHSAVRTIFGRMFDKFVFPSKGVDSAMGDSKTSSNVRRNSTIKDYRIRIKKNFKLPGLNEYKFADLKRATSNFSEYHMSRKDEYLGRLENNDTYGSSIHVIKRFLEGEVEEWVAELNLLGRLAHPNIISLVGYCNDSKHERLLVYKYMQNGSFHHCLHGGVANRNTAEPLSWGTRLAIMIGVARGLAYLHSLDIVHGDLKSSSILLDQDFNAKLVDFMVESVNQETYTFTTFVDDTGYLDPDFMYTGRRSTMESDIYSFEVVLLETLTSCKPIDRNRPQGKQRLVDRARPYLEGSSDLEEIMDPHLKGNYSFEGAFKCAEFARRCLAFRPEHRPSSEEVLRWLEEMHVFHK